MSVASKNPYDLLGNEDGDAEAPVKTTPAARNAKTESKGQPRRAGASGNEAAFRDRGAGSDRNRTKPTDDAPRGGARGGYGARVRGGRGSRHPRDRDDRHSKGLPGAHEKHASGAVEGNSERKDEEAGEEIAKHDEKDAGAEDAGAEDAEPEDKQISYDDYVAQLAEKKLTLSDGSLSVRQANEGTKANKQWASATPLVKDDDDEFISGTGGKAKRERERKVKQLVEIDQRYVEPERPRGGARGGRGGPRGGRGGSDSFRGGPRGGGRGGARGGSRGRGEPRGAFRGASSRGAESLNPKDETAFPSLGSN